MLSDLVDIDVQNGVTSARRLIHLLTGYLSEWHARIDDIDSLINCLNGHFY